MLFYTKNKISKFLGPQIFPKKTSKWKKTIFYLAKHTSFQIQGKSKTCHDHCSKLSMLKLLFWLKSNISELLSNQILKKKVNESLKPIFCLPHYAYLLSKASSKTDHGHSSKLCLLKCIILLEKQLFRVFQHWNIRNESRWVNKNHFLSYRLCIFLN